MYIGMYVHDKCTMKKSKHEGWDVTKKIKIINNEWKYVYAACAKHSGQRWV